MSAIQKLVAGGPGRPTRLHTESGERIPFRELSQLPRVLRNYVARRMIGRRPDEPWWPMPVLPVVAAHLNSQAKVLEFGSGSSTIWLAKRAGDVVSVEDNLKWTRIVKDRIAVLGLTNARIWHAEGRDYYDLSWLGKTMFDLVIVDGSYRWKCIEAALPRIRPGGMLYLDNSDADKDREFYPDARMSRVAQSLLEAYAEKESRATLDRHAGLISGELHAGEGIVLRLASA
jgi:precorrin-6B methylase 2